MLKLRVARFIKSQLFYNAILCIIVLNAIVIGLQTIESISSDYAEVLNKINLLCLTVFIIEFILRIYIYRTRFFLKRWDVFDLIVVLISLLPESYVVSTFRFLRVIRVLRLISVIPKIQLITQVLLRTLSSIISVGILLMIVYYVYAVITTTLYGKDFPQWFGTIGESYYTLFQIMTFESWSMGIVRPVMEIHPYSWIVFISFLIIATYIVLNIVIGIIVDCIGEIKNSDCECDSSEQNYQKLSEQMISLSEELKEIKSLLKHK